MLALQTSWKGEVLSSGSPSAPVSPAASAAQKGPLLQQLRWVPDGSAVLALDRAGNLGAVDCGGIVQGLSLTMAKSKVPPYCKLYPPVTKICPRRY